MPDITVRTYEVKPGLGRHLVLDVRSLAYRRRYAGEPLHIADWEPRIPVLDQQNLTAQGIQTSELYPGEDNVDALGSCTGNAGTALLSVLLDRDTAAAAGLDIASAVAAEEFAIGLYSDATRADTWQDQSWPHTDCGSSGLGVAKVLRNRGLVDQYGHATTAEELCTLLQTGPVLAGIPWYNAWFDAEGSARLDDIPDWEASGLAGGHEICVTALEAVALDESGRLVPERTILRARNSWGPGWGDGGSFHFSLALYTHLRDQIDIVQPRLDTAGR